jgi:uncharacterized protein (DUF1684 family)
MDCHARHLIPLLLAACTATPPAPDAPPPHPPPTATELAEDVTAWAVVRHQLVAGSGGPFTLIGLCRLPESSLPATIGGDTGSGCTIPGGHAPVRLGRLVAHEDSLQLDPAVPVFWVGERARREAALLARRDHPEEDGAAAWHGPLRLNAQWSDGQATIWITDTLAPARSAFTGIARWPTDTAWWFPATFTASDPAWRQVPTVRGFDLPQQVAGTVTMVRGADTLHLEAWSRGRRARTMLVVIRDATSGDGSYAAGRFVDVPLPDSLGRTVVDFNLARNPDCAFTAASACPLPPPTNRLPFAVTAGERSWPE